MAFYDNTKFFYLQLKEDFFEEDTINWLEEQPNGKEYSLFYLKLCLKSLSMNGVLIRKVGDLLIPYDHIKLGEITNTSPDTVLVATDLLVKIGLIKMLDNGALYLTQVENMIGSQSKSAFKKQQQRERKLGGVDICPPKCPPNINLNLKLKTKSIEDKSSCLAEPRPIETFDDFPSAEEVEKEPKQPRVCVPFAEIIDYLNEKTGKSFKSTSRKTQGLIRARWNEGFRLEDFKKVIDNKCSTWLRDTRMNQYLRPETLFSGKFDRYLNEKPGSNEPEWLNEHLNALDERITKNTGSSEPITEENIQELEDFFKGGN